jgi:small multidrug resistance family-3 protein
MSPGPAYSTLTLAVILVLAAAFEVGGDALIRAGLRGKVLWLVVLGFCALGSYGLVLNQIAIDFSKLLGVYVGLFALVSVLFGKVLFHETVANGTWLGLAVVLAGSAIIQWG